MSLIADRVIAPGVQSNSELTAAWEILRAIQLHHVRVPEMLENSYYQEAVQSAHCNYAFQFNAAKP